VVVSGCKRYDGKTLFASIEKGDLEFAKQIIRKDPGLVHALNSEGLGETPLHIASKKGEKEIADELLLAGADVNAQNRWHVTPLHFAADAGHISIVELLIKNRANLNVKDHLDMTPLHFACRKGHVAIVDLIVKNGGDTAIDGLSGNLLHAAVESNRPEVV